jgi:pilus assembly protein CpaF
LANLRTQIAQWGNLPTASVDPPPAGRKQDDVPYSSSAEAEGYFEYKSKLLGRVLEMLDLGSAETMPPDVLKEHLRSLVEEAIREDVLPLNEEEHGRLVTDIQHEILGLGPMEALLSDPSISEIMVNGARQIFLERAGKIELSTLRFDDDEHLRKVIDRIVSRVGRRIDEGSPMVDARLPDGSRVNAIIPPLAVDGPVLTIRRFAMVPLQIHDLVAKQALTQDMADLLAGLVRAKANIIVSGGTGSGKTTLLNILSSFIPRNERIITLEDTAELQLQQPHVVRLESRPANVEGIGAVSMRALVNNSLRMRPDRIVVGEVRGSEVLDMLQAMNTGHNGSLATIHANTPRDALARLENLVNLSGVQIPVKALRQQITAAVNFIVQTNRVLDGSRKVVSITEITGMEGEVISTQDIFSYEIETTDADGQMIGQFRPTGVRPDFTDELVRSGIHLNPEIFNASGLNLS